MLLTHLLTMCIDILEAENPPACEAGGFHGDPATNNDEDRLARNAEAEEACKCDPRVTPKARPC